MKTKEMGELNRRVILRAIKEAGPGGVATVDLCRKTALGARSVGDHLRALREAKEVVYTGRKWALSIHVKKA